MLRPATKHKFRFEYTPITYEAEKTVTRTFIFNGQRYDIGLPVTSEIKWKAYRFSYEWDFLYRDRGFLGMLLETKYTDINATLSTAFAGVSTSSSRTRARRFPRSASSAACTPRPTSRSRASSADSGTTATPCSRTRTTAASIYDFDLYGTVNFTDHFGAHGGYRSFDVFYKVKEDNGTMTLKGLYFGADVRF